MVTFEEIKEDLRKVLEVLAEDDHHIKEFCTENPDKRLTVENLEILAADYVFEESAEKFGITTEASSKIGEFFEEKPFGRYNYVEELHKAFPDILQPERKEYLNKINRDRWEFKLGPLNVPVYEGEQ